MINSNGLIPSEIIDEIKSKTDIVDYISSKQKLNKRSDKYYGMCPICNKTQSFVVYPQTKSFYCFACNFGGDVINYVMKTENTDYRTAAEKLAKNIGILITESKRQTLNNLLRDAAIFYHAQLRTNDRAKSAIAQLHTWGVKGKAIVQLGIGFHDDSFNCFIEYMTKEKSYTISQLVEAQLVARSSKGTFFDKMRNSIIIPTIDTTGNVVCFDYYSIDKALLYKYPNTVTFNRTNYLYSLNSAINSGKKSLIIVSNYEDYFKLFGLGITNVAATYLPKITNEQLDTIKKHFRFVIMFFPPYINLTSCFKYCKANSMFCEKIQLLGFDSPAEYLNEHGTDTIIKKIEEFEKI